MAELMGAANRVPGYDSANNNRTQLVPSRSGDPQVQNVPDPSRVVRADAKTEQQTADQGLESNVLRYDSNLQTFLEQLRQTPELSQIMSKTILMLKGMVSVPGLQEGIAQEMAQLLDMLKLDEQSLREFFMEQVRGNNRFSGALFSLLRQAYSQLSSGHARQAILEFARRYSDFSSTGHIGKNMLTLLKQMEDYLPKSWRGQLEDMATRLENGLQAGTREENLGLLQREVVPYLGRYVERAHDFGPLRSLLNLLVLNIARYEDGAEGPLLAAFRQLGRYGDLLSGLNKLDDTAILKLLKENDFARAAASPFVQGMARAAGQAMKGELGTDAWESFAELIRALLVNESVYMPLHHMMFPVEWDGKMMYSELWVDPDAEDGRQGAGQNGEKVQFLFKLDVESLGVVEVTLAAREDQVELHIYGPEAVSGNSAIVAEDMREILSRHQLSGKNIQVSKLETPLALTQVFPNLFEGKQGVNVKV
ncbi:hypothetical protein [uncultured Pseudoflavonifractor sp.]|uniref:hypothetical protein n=1 Tax=uncultured Pseudoflavonifractor sp. TaxID=1221379 RepID=UPI0025F008B1|nr:hypothetical protein [uncultured Pseudoflavonifractor sp.]